MKSRSLLLSMLMVATLAVATERVRFAPTQSSTITITGTSTLHEWQMQGTTINGAIEIAPEIAADPANADAWRAAKALVTVNIPVSEIRNEHPRMNHIMLEAMKAKTYPAVRYELLQAALANGKGDSFLLKTKGKLTIAGVTRDLDMDITGSRATETRYALTGEAPIKMTEFGITPPVTMMGALKTGDQVKVTFRWVVDRVQ